MAGGQRTAARRLVRAGAAFHNGVLVERGDEQEAAAEPRTRRRRDDHLPDVRRGIPARRPPAALLDPMPSTSVEAPPVGTGRTARGPLRHRLRLPGLRSPLPGPATLRRLQHLVPSAWSRWAVSLL